MLHEALRKTSCNWSSLSRFAVTLWQRVGNASKA